MLYNRLKGHSVLNNSEMKKGRILKIYNGKKRFNTIDQHLKNGGSILICTYTRATKYTPKHREMFMLGKSGSVYVQRGKNWDSIDFCGIKLI